MSAHHPWASRFMMPEASGAEIARRVGWTFIVAMSFLALGKLTSLIAFGVMIALWIRRLNGHKGLALPLTFAIFVSSAVAPIDVIPGNMPGPPKLLRVLHGMPSPEALEIARRGEIILGGCVVHPFQANWVLVW